ncbi:MULTISPECIES: hypothetical protein [Acetobacter]|uniref:Uncharacterized protein n=1 Tax=Acetobacter cerevisiae TaxID=178900 RepID=A0A149VF11_9PROT|nr:MULTISPECIES: hypothetical protein [Acetobacter]KXV78754.1 hypothetical protein AD954_01110 [Acetobacter cerevisiae]MCP1229876.1 hypothetical protein [Acetobacter indonesiensis]OUI94062.1 hypothetical protein HK13_06780 [Acetobacter indonesiensis]
MSARFDDTATGQLSRAVVEEALSKLEMCLRAGDIHQPGMGGPEAAEVLAINFVIALAHERRGADGVMEQMWRSFRAGFVILSRAGDVPPHLAEMAAAFGVNP